MMFLDLRGKLFSEGEIEGNFGLGYLQRLNPDANIGVYGFLDVRQSEANNTFYQVTMGAEYLTRDWCLRGNLYIPVSDDKEIAAMNGINIAGSSAITVRNTTVTTAAGAPVTMTGLRSVNTDGLTLENLTVSNVTGSGVRVQGDNATFDGVMVSNVGNAGIRFEGADSQLGNLSVDGAGSTGVLIFSSRNVDVDGVLVRDATVTGFAIDTFTLLRNGPSRDIRVSNLSVDGGDFGVRVGRRSRNVVLDGLDISNARSSNILLDNATNITVRNAVLRGRGGEFGIFARDSMLDLSNVQVTGGTSQAAIRLEGNGGADFSGVELLGTGGNAFELSNSQIVDGDILVQPIGYSGLCVTGRATVTGSVDMSFTTPAPPPATCP